MHAEILNLLNSPFGCVVPPRVLGNSTGAKCVFVLANTNTNTEDHLLLLQTDSKVISIKTIILRSTGKKMTLARNYTMFLSKLGRENKRQADENCLLI